VRIRTRVRCVRCIFCIESRGDAVGLSTHLFTQTQLLSRNADGPTPSPHPPRQNLMDELDALEEDLAAEAETGAVPSYLQEDTLPDVPAPGVTNDPVNPEAPVAYPAIQTDEYGLPMAPQH